ncbi:uncharacterized protein B0H64DRAFT_84523 [Chaetomium fimeti]|uniref:Uncharacterized protein n=1 Tax=Chaetomium fimeti TaxID=1854472 RepID=A0AAE0LVB1_9PEZI|nr:hypothetical protein B0H64DRAFT_84523 [Chaetomium fimeti]
MWWVPSLLLPLSPFLLLLLFFHRYYSSHAISTDLNYEVLRTSSYAGNSSDEEDRQGSTQPSRFDAESLRPWEDEQCLMIFVRG